MAEEIILISIGVIIGLLSATFVMTVMIFLRNPIERVVEITKNVIESKGPKPKGFVYIPPDDEIEEERERIIEENSRKGKDTKIDDLRPI